MLAVMTVLLYVLQYHLFINTALDYIDASKTSGLSNIFRNCYSDAAVMTVVFDAKKHLCFFHDNSLQRICYKITFWTISILATKGQLHRCQLNFACTKRSCDVATLFISGSQYCHGN